MTVPKKVLRKVAGVHGPLRPLNARMGQHDRLWYQHILAKYPASFNGSIPAEVPYLEYTTSVPNDASSAFPESHGVAALAGRDRHRRRRQPLAHRSRRGHRNGQGPVGPFLRTRNGQVPRTRYSGEPAGV